jgi:uncharacterized protein YjdB
MHRVSRFAIGLAVVVGSLSCSDAVSRPAPVTSTMMGVTDVTVAPTELNIAVGATFRFAATVDAPSWILDRAVLWSSSDTTVATVDSSGLVTARHAGPATIVAASRSDPTVRAEATVDCADGSPGKPSIRVVRVLQ